MCLEIDTHAPAWLQPALHVSSTTHTCRVWTSSDLAVSPKKRQDFLIFATHAHACMHWEYHITFKRNSPIASAKRPDHSKFSDAPNTLMCAGSSISAPSTTICALGHGVLTFHNTHVCVRTDKPSSQFRGTGLLAHRST